MPWPLAEVRYTGSSDRRAFDMGDGERMKLRMTMAGIMTFTALVAVDLGVAINIIHVPANTDQLNDFLMLSLFGTLPMANILVAGVLILRKNRERAGRQSAFLLGFEWAGLMAVSIFVMLTVFAGEGLRLYVGFLVESVIPPIPQVSSDICLALSIAVGALLVPQLVPALVVGWFHDRASRNRSS